MRALLCLCMFLASVVALRAADDSVADPVWREELILMARADQALRREISALRGAPPPEELLARMRKLDGDNTAKLKKMIAKRGWPTPAAVGDIGVAAAFLIVQHADRDRAFQREMLPVIETAFRAGGDGITGEDFALLTDRVRIGDGRPQLYGTQFDIRERKIVVKPVESPEQLDARRASLGLPPMDQYLRLAAEYYQLPAAEPEAPTPKSVR